MLNKEEFYHLTEKLKLFESMESYDKKAALNNLAFEIQNKTNIFELLNEDQSIEEINEVSKNYIYNNIISMMLKEIIDLKVAVKNIEQVLQDLVEKNGSHIRIQ